MELVKQIIGWTNILPLSSVWASTNLSFKLRRFIPSRQSYRFQDMRSQADIVRQGTPSGGVLLHFIFSVVMICVSRGFTSFQESLSFPGSLLIYGHFVFEGRPPDCGCCAGHRDVRTIADTMQCSSRSGMHLYTTL